MSPRNGHKLAQLLASHLTLRQTKQIHAAVLISRQPLDSFLATKILRSYAKAHDIRSARRLFDGIPSRSVYIWNTIIRAHAMDHDLYSVSELFSLMRSSDTRPDGHTCACLSRACTDEEDPLGVTSVHGIMVVTGLQHDHVGCCGLINNYFKFGMLFEASTLFEQLQDRDLALWNVMISGCASHGFYQKGVDLFQNMRAQEQKPDGYTMVGVVSCFWDSAWLRTGRGVHGLCLQAGLDLNDHVRSALVSMYARCNCLDAAYQVFECIVLPDLVTWSSMISAFALRGEHDKALSFFCKMTSLGTGPDSVLVTSVLSSCASVASIRLGRMMHGFAVKTRLDSDILVSCGLTDMYIKCGFGQLGIRMFETMPKRTTTAFNILILGLGSHGLAHQAIRLFSRMLSDGIWPDAATFSALLFACCHSALLEDGWMLFNRMENDFGIKPRIEHYVYMVKLLGMKGYLHDAYNLIQTMPMKPDSGVLGALLWSCNVHGNLEVGKVVASQLFETAPNRTSYRIMLSNIYTAQGKWNTAQGVRNGLIQGATKSPGISQINGDGSWNGNLEACLM